MNQIASQADEALFNREKTRLIVRMLAISTLVIFVTETLLMLLLEVVLDLPQPVILTLDGLILVACLFPLNYHYVILPKVREIEQHRKTIQVLSHSFEMLENFFSINDVQIVYLDAKFNFLRVNKAYALADGHEPGYYLEKNYFDLFPNSETQTLFDRVIQTGQSVNVIEKPFEHPLNPERGVSYWDWTILPVKGSENQVVSMLVVLNDVTIRKQAQQALAESERRFRGVFNQTFQHIVVLDPDGQVLLINQTALAFTGLSAEAAAGKPLWLLPWWSAEFTGQEMMRESIRQAAAGSVVRLEQQVQSTESGRAIMDITIKPLLDDEGRTTMLIYEARDITTRIRAEEALMRSEEKSKRLYQAEMRAHHLAETLRSAVVALSGSLDSSTVIETLLDHLFKVIPYRSAHISLLDDEDHLLVRFARGDEDWGAEHRLLGKRFDNAELPIFEALINEQHSLSIPDTQRYDSTSFFPDPQRVRSWIAIPLLAGKHMIGICTLEHDSVDFFTEDMIQWASALIRQAAVAVENAWLFEQVRDGREHLQALSQRLVEVQELERLHIARELHDEAGQAVASLLVGLRLLERDGGDRQAVAARCIELKQVADGVLENLHRLAMDLRPASLDHLGLVAALRQHTEMISDQHNLAIRFETIGEIKRMPGEVETAVYRIVQEALTNVVRHAQATRVDILLERHDDKLLVVVEDNGVGFDLQDHKDHQLGLVGMRERAIMLNGSINFESIPNQGSTVLLEVPCQFE